MQELKHLVEGYKEFSNSEKRDGQYRYSKLAAGQSPKVMVVSCSDSRVIPSLIFNVKPGDLFVVRNVANIVPPFENDDSQHGTSAALEFAVLGLDVDHIVVLGHSQCGGIQACFNKEELAKTCFIGNWLSIIEPVADKVCATHADCSSEDRQRALEWESIRASLDNLRTFPFITEKMEQGSLTIHGAYFDIQDGQLYLHDKTSDKFCKVD